MALAACAMATHAAAAPDAADSPEARFAALKRLERAILISPAAEERVALEQRAAALRRARAARTTRSSRSTRAPLTARRRAAGLRQETPRERLETLGAPGARRATHTIIRLVAPANHPVNRRAGDTYPNSAQCEGSVALWGRFGLAAWNDGEGSLTDDYIGYAWTTDGGRTWTDAGAPPRGNGVAVWSSDPVIAIDEHSGTFHLCALAIGDSARNAVAIASGGFGPQGFAFHDVEVARAPVRDTLPDKPWLAVDPATGTLYLTYTSFFGRGAAMRDQIELQRRDPEEGAWAAPIKLSPDSDDGLVQGSRPAVGPDGEVHVVWKLVDTTDAHGGRDVIRLRTSRDRAASFGLTRDVAAQFTNFGSGAPGFNRGFGFAFPGIAVDRSAGPHRGRIYVTWNESIDFFGDVLGTHGPVAEAAEPDNEPATASPFNLGQTIHGRLESSNDVDLYRFHAEAGQTAILHLDSLATGMDVSMRLLCSDGSTRLAYCSPPEVLPRLLVYTLPAAGDYFIRIAGNNDIAGEYRIATGTHGAAVERARDHRDVFVATSDDGVAWREPVRVNAEPAGYDDWLPEVAVDAAGRAWAAWYDWHDAPESTCGGGSAVWLARSVDGGAAWEPMGPMSDAVTEWTDVASSLAPNQGDYIAISATDSVVLVAWSDGRAGDPDIYASARALTDTPIPTPPPPPVTVALERPRPNPTAGTLVVRFELPVTAPARVELLDAGGRPWRTVTLPAAAAGPMQVDLTAGPRLAPGLYFVRVAQGANSATHKVVVVR